MRGRGKLPTWLERRGYSRRLKRTFARRQILRQVRRRARLRSDRERAAPVGRSPFGGNVVPFPVRVRPVRGEDTAT